MFASPRSLAARIGHFRMVVKAAVAKPSPEIGQVLGPLGVNMMNFCKEFNARTATIKPETPCQVTMIAYTDKSQKFFIRTPSSKWFVRRCARVATGGDAGLKNIVGNITVKELYHIALAKSMDPQFVGRPLRAICIALIGTAHAYGIKVTEELQPEYKNRDQVPIGLLEQMKKDNRMRNKSAKRKGK
jgi:large subunit ribosomal protein L11